MKTLSFILFWTLVYNTVAQTFNNSTYPLSTYTGIALEDLSLEPTIIGPNASFASYSSVIPFGSDFKFCYNGFCHDSFRVQVNGKLGFGESTLFAQNSINDVITPISNRMTTGTNGWVKYKLMGSAPNRKLVVEWKVRMQTTSLTVSAIHSFQLWLNENGRIDFVYGDMPSSWNGTTLQTYSIWLAYNKITPGTTTVAVGSPFANSSANYSGTTGNQTTTIAPQSMLSFIPSQVPVSLPPIAFDPVYPSCLRMQILDTTTNEYGFRVYRSDDGIHYDYFLENISTITANNLDTFYVNDSLLQPNTTYYYAVVPYNLGLIPDTLFTSITTPSPMLAGIYSIPGDYSTINEALEDIHCKQLATHVYLELDDSYNFSQETLPILIDQRILSSPTQTLTIRPKSGSAGIQFNNPSNQPVFVLQNAAHFRLDGSPGGNGVENLITINQLNSVSPAILFKDTAVNNSIANCNIKGKGSTNHLQDESLILLNGTKLTHNTIESCSFSNLPNEWLKNGIIAVAGSAQQLSDSNNILNCNFSNFGIQSGKTVSSATVAAIKINDFNSGWNIEGNSFYMTDVLQTTFSSCVVINSPSGENFSIKNNWFGGSAPFCQGNKLEVVTSVFPRGFQYIKLHGGSNSIHNISGNHFDNVHVLIPTTGSFENFDFIHAKALQLNVDSNIVGNTLDPLSVRYELSNSSSPIFDLNFISFHGSAVLPHQVKIRSNQFHNLKATGKINVNGIAIVSGINNNVGDNFDINSNVIGGISRMSVHSDERFTGITGIFGLNDKLQIANNTIRNFWGKIDAIGIKVSDAQYTVNNQDTAHVYITGNTIAHGLSDLSVAGCYLTSDRGKASIQKNDIYALKCLLGNQYSKGVVNGIATHFFQSATPCLVDGNKIHHLDALLPLAIIEGIHHHGRGITQNNMIALGRNMFGNFINDSIKVSGMIINSFPGMDTVIVRHNSIYLTGDSIDYTSGFFTVSALSRAVFCVNRPNTHFSNNLIVTNRSNALVDFGTNSNLQLGGYCDYNQYFSNRPDYFGEETPIDYLTFDEWNTNYGQDLNSFFMPPYFVQADGDSATWDLHLQAHNYSESNGLITNLELDIDGDNRTVLSPADIGADAGDFYSIPILDLGPATQVLCIGDSIYLSADSDYEHYNWNTGSNSNGIYITEPGTYSLTITDAFGYTSSDSVSVTSSSVPTFNLPSDTIICLNTTIELQLPANFATYSWSNGDTTHSTILTNPGIYHVAVTNEVGCTTIDSISIITDSLYDYEFTQTHSICNSDSIQIILQPEEFIYTWHDTNHISNSITLWEQSTNYFTASSPSGCSFTDSIVINTVIVGESTPDYLSICAGDSISIYGTFVSSSGTYTSTLTTNLGCDSIVSTILTVLDLMSTQLPTLEICAGDSIQVFNNFIYESGIYEHTLQSIEGCDSIITQEVIVHPTPIVQLNDFSPNLICINSGLTALPVGTPSGGDYFGEGITSLNFDPFEAGNGTHVIYYSYANEYNCMSKDSSIIIVDLCLGIETLNLNPSIQVVPNPSSGIFLIKRNENSTEQIQLQLFDVTGKFISYYVLSAENPSELSIDIQDQENGVYLLYSDSTVVKLIKQQ